MTEQTSNNVKANTANEHKKRETVINMQKYMDKAVRIKFIGGREVAGILKGFDPLLNLVLDGATEYLRDPEDLSHLSGEMRPLGLVVCRGNAVSLVCPVEGMTEISNPFIAVQN